MTAEPPAPVSAVAGPPRIDYETEREHDYAPVSAVAGPPRIDYETEREHDYAPVSAVAGPEPDEGLHWATLPLWDAETARREHEDPILGLWAALNVLWPHLRALAAPAAAPVGDEGLDDATVDYDCACAWPADYSEAVTRTRGPRHGRGCELYATAACPPGDEGAARAAVARVLALCDAAEANTRGQHLAPPNDDIAYITTRMLRAALSAVSGEHREDER